MEEKPLGGIGLTPLGIRRVKLQNEPLPKAIEEELLIANNSV